MKYCSSCGSSVVYKIPEGDNRSRYVCDNCGTIHYQNPKIVVGSIPVWENRILLCKRAIEPRKGYWTLPAGFLENRETVEEGAVRETREEANAEIRIVGLQSVYSIPHISQIYMFFLADLVDGKFSVSSESEEVKLFSLNEIPWEELAFSSVQFALREYADSPVKNSLHLGNTRNRKNFPK
ncbi:NUDIX hydrolase [Leptospira santarosai]|uniref:ADP-ribose pyrophosphatase n=2 Tax=Leptospira santarosai TaxID=28183 RepID=K8XZP3_9LEPT|nr:NUDIX hydrolase [Leptospira santarosai]EKS08463.1 NUDIX domain protein [Leptospira santarosai str. JET]EKT86301.1 ADP-ribose pyrophosphatase [Leptospira santarosai serovar Shermani str. LT 821]EMF91659.1 NUDIX domain protein [Leptospira santarosai str. ST188]EMM75390.1 NUDIX domain protein [Leptospira santarosai str. 2000030832]EMN21914.1 NUDIX domain protein [Leptospira santarosai serovar Arenal str. MAVJ 401]